MDITRRDNNVFKMFSSSEHFVQHFTALWTIALSKSFWDARFTKLLIIQISTDFTRNFSIDPYGQSRFSLPVLLSWIQPLRLYKQNNVTVTLFFLIGVSNQFKINSPNSPFAHVICPCRLFWWGWVSPFADEKLYLLLLACLLTLDDMDNAGKRIVWYWIFYNNLVILNGNFS